MSLTVNSRVLGEETTRAVNLIEEVGGYALTFFADFRMTPAGIVDCEAELFGADVTLISGGAPRRLGYVRPERPIRLKPYDHGGQEQILFSMSFGPSQIAALEEARNGGDLDFQLRIVGEGRDPAMMDKRPVPVHGDWKFHVPRSTWIATLRQARVINILLFEVPVPTGAKSPHAVKAIEYLEKAKAKFLEGDYRGCVAECRTVAQEMGTALSGDAKWHDGLLKKLPAGDRSLSKDERELAVFAAIRSFAHLAHHGESEDGVADYTRADASFALGVAAVLSARATRT